MNLTITKFTSFKNEFDNYNYEMLPRNSISPRTIIFLFLFILSLIDISPIQEAFLPVLIVIWFMLLSEEILVLIFPYYFSSYFSKNVFYITTN